MMLNRRHALQGGIAAIGALSAAHGAPAQRKPSVKVRYSEVVRSILYAPAYVAMSKGFFSEAGLDVALTTAQGGDKTVAALLSNSADIALIGPERAIYVLTSESPTKILLFCGLTSTDGDVLVGRQKIDKFEWNMLRGKEILGRIPGTTPLLYLEAALRKNGLEPYRDVKLVNNVAIPARMGAWLAGQTQFGIFVEPEASQLELDGKAHFLASIGLTMGYADFTAFMSTDKYIRENPDIVQSWTDAIYRAQQWTAAAQTDEIVEVIKPYFPGIAVPVLTAAAARYRAMNIWKTTPVIEPPAIEVFQDILVQGNVLAPAKRVKFADLVLTTFASKAK
jgi:NitT/TauT family transport system substrate-binding protein